MITKTIAALALSGATLLGASNAASEPLLSITQSPPDSMSAASGYDDVGYSGASEIVLLSCDPSASVSRQAYLIGTTSAASTPGEVFGKLPLAPDGGANAWDMVLFSGSKVAGQSGCYTDFTGSAIDTQTVVAASSITPAAGAGEAILPGQSTTPHPFDAASVAATSVATTAPYVAPESITPLSFAPITEAPAYTTPAPPVATPVVRESVVRAAVAQPSSSWLLWALIALVFLGFESLSTLKKLRGHQRNIGIMSGLIFVAALVLPFIAVESASGQWIELPLGIFMGLVSGIVASKRIGAYRGVRVGLRDLWEWITDWTTIGIGVAIGAASWWIWDTATGIYLGAVGTLIAASVLHHRSAREIAHNRSLVASKLAAVLNITVNELSDYGRWTLFDSGDILVSHLTPGMLKNQPGLADRVAEIMPLMELSESTPDRIRITGASAETIENRRHLRNSGGLLATGTTEDVESTEELEPAESSDFEITDGDW